MTAMPLSKSKALESTGSRTSFMFDSIGAGPPPPNSASKSAPSRCSRTSSASLKRRKVLASAGREFAATLLPFALVFPAAPGI